MGVKCCGEMTSYFVYQPTIVVHISAMARLFGSVAPAAQYLISGYWFRAHTFGLVFQCCGLKHQIMKIVIFV